MKIKFFCIHPLSYFGGGTVNHIQETMNSLKALKHNVEYLDLSDKKVDFDALIVFGCTFYDANVFKFYREKGVKVLIVPIFDRLKPLWILKLLKFFLKLPILNLYTLRKSIFDNVDYIVTSNESEKRDISVLYNIDSNKISVSHLGISEEIIKLDDRIDSDIFYKKYGLKDFIFCPAVAVSTQKNQINLLKAVAGTDLKVVINNTHVVQDDLKEEFWTLAKANPNVVTLERLSLEELVSCYKCASLSVSVSNAETAGLVNLEAGYLGCRLAVSNLEALNEYLKGYATYFDQKNPKSILEGIQKALKTKYNPEIKKYILKECRWQNYVAKIDTLLS